jgi:hypothetical protein
MMKQTPHRSSKKEKLPKVAEHVRYEIRLLIFSAEHVGGCHASPVVTPQGDEKNMALESFLLHFRNLRVFLCPSLQEGNVFPDDVLASDFTGKFDCSDVGDKTKFPPEEQKRLNKMLTHISYKRPDYEPRDYQWDTSEMLIRMLDELQRFVGTLTQEQRSWFPSADELKQVQARTLTEIEMRGSVSNSTVTGRPFRWNLE